MGQDANVSAAPAVAAQGLVPLPPGVVQLIVVLGVVLVGLVVLWSTGAGYDFKVRLRGEKVDVTGRRVSPALRSALVQFFQHDFPRRDRLTIYGRRRGNRTYDLRFHGNITAGEKQQVRNFLTSGV